MHLNTVTDVTKPSKWILISLGVIGLLFIPHPALADTNPLFDFPALNDMLNNIQRQIPYLNQFLSATAYLIGFYMVFKALYELKKYGEARTMMSNNTDFRGPSTMLIMGAFMIFFPTFIDISLTTVFGNANILQYTDTNNANWDNMRETIIKIVQFIGAAAVFRGGLFFHKVGTGQAQPNTLTRAFTHVIGGVLCLNIVAAKDILYGTLGILQS